jgi:pimeloyl-ACP methyl ester carboxylesterase
MQRRLMLTAVAAAALLAACGGGNDDDYRGSLIDDPAVVTTLTASAINSGTAASGLAPLTGAAKCDVQVVSLNYRTPGVQGEVTNSSGVLLLPAGACAAQSHPLIAYAKGTDVQKPRTLANPADGETFLLAAMYAAQGYAVVATDYLGFAKSTYGYHPYLHADSEATTVVDSIRAARRAASKSNATLNGKVMVTGYSQGGHSSMAAHRAIEQSHANEINLVAGAHLAGPYNLSGSFKLPDAIAGYQFFVPYLVTAWQKVYGNIYSNVNQAFKAPYASYIETLLPSPDLTYTTLVTTGKLPGGPGVTPNAARDLVFQSAFITDSQTNPNNPLFLAAKKNDLLGWNPKARTLLCGGAGDPTVPPAVHQAVAKADFDSRGLTNVTSVDVDPLVRATFGVNGAAPTDPTSAAFATYYGNYHGTYEPPFCHAQARAVFDTVK